MDGRAVPISAPTVRGAVATLSHAAIVGPAAVVVGSVLFAQAIVPDIVWDLTREDGLVETATVLMWLLAAVTYVDVAWLSIGRRARGLGSARTPFVGALAMAGVSLLIALEEMSWGQRIFDVDAPTAVEFVNRQDEINLHNTEILHHLMRPLSLAVSGLLLLGKPWRIRRGGTAGRLLSRFGPPIIPTRHAWGWLAATVLTLCPILVRGTYYGPFDEIGELVMSMQFSFAAAWLVLGSRRSNEVRPEPDVR